MWPQITMLILLFGELLIAAYQHDKEREPANFWYKAIDVAFYSWVLYWGGFFDNFLH